MIDIDDIDEETYVRENREQIKAVIKHSEDEFARACAWVLLDKYSDDADLDTLAEELDTLRNQRGVDA
ncbi:hypothetical protein [Halomarina litorea]|uniref:hypothetical protein n=1 Tax=Halomarina litorea TaxID=2961595 RepID=UPI0020C54EB6|nr:hypothetical protein [Halomarina sp. BCD28]